MGICRKICLSLAFVCWYFCHPKKIAKNIKHYFFSSVRHSQMMFDIRRLQRVACEEVTNVSVKLLQQPYRLKGPGHGNVCDYCLFTSFFREIRLVTIKDNC